MGRNRTIANVSARPNKLRIIGGLWRGRKLEFPPLATIRPTPDRVRETVFNWLRNDISGARCLDLFAGSGALGLESLSRGAEHVVFVDREQAVKRYLQQVLKLLGANNAEIVVGDAARVSLKQNKPFDIVFLDPPFGANLLTTICARLEADDWLAPHALIYLECAADQPMPTLPLTWNLIKSKKAGQVGYHLARRNPR